jgi:hypothetical protein
LDRHTAVQADAGEGDFGAEGALDVGLLGQAAGSLFGGR